MSARRWILVPVPRAASVAPIVLAIALLVGLGLAALALAFGSGEPPAVASPARAPAVPANAPPGPRLDSLAVPSKVPGQAGQWM